MKILSTVLAAITLSAGAALAQVTTTTTTQQTVTPVQTVTTPGMVCPVAVLPTSSVMPTSMPMATATCPVGVMPATTMGASTAVSTQVAACPTGIPAAPAPCAAKMALSINNSPQVLVLGSEEYYALGSLGVRGLNIRDTIAGSQSIFSPFNPLTNNMPNASITRHGNPNFPYYAVDRSVRVAGTVEHFIATNPLPAGSQDILTSVKDRYRDITPQQAMALGYAPIQACVQNVGFVYLNQSLIDNRFDPMTPEAFTFDDKGHLLSVQYFLLSDVPFAAFGQPFQASPIVAGAMQLPVWLYKSNDQGMFTLANPDVSCGAPPSTLAAPAVSIQQIQAPRQY